MPRPRRLQIPGITFHVVQRGNNRDRTFFVDEDYRTYLYLLEGMANRYETSVHAYVLMTNHIHLLVTSRRADGISRMMQQVSSTYARRVNERDQRTGTLWESRFRSSPVDSDYYCLACYRYIEMNPVRAGIVERPEHYRWSSYAFNSGRKSNGIIDPHPSFLALARLATDRAVQYRSMVEYQLPPETLTAIRDGARRNQPVGNERFVRNVSKVQQARSVSAKSVSEP